MDVKHRGIWQGGGFGVILTNGCRVNAKSYAVDMVLLSPHVDALLMMLNICESEAAKFDIKFNTSKSVCMLLKPRDQGFQ